MNSFKGFASLPALANNLPGQTAAFGELSPIARTYSRGQLSYVDDSMPSIELVGFSAKTDAGAVFTPSSGLVSHILSVIYWVYGQYNDGLIPPNASKNDFIDNLSAAFPGLLNSITVNEIITGSPITARMPDFIEWVYTDSGQDILSRIWFSDVRFRSQYDEYEIVLVPPLSNLDDLNASTGVVTNLLAARTPALVQAEITTAQNGVPCTSVTPYDITWHNPSNPASTLVTTWMAVGYGIAGADVDNIKDAIRDYITSNTALAGGTWNVIYPSLYAENEFSIIPLWDDVSVPEAGLQVEMYKASVKVGSLINIAAARIPASYADSVVIANYLNANLEVASAFFRSLSFMTVGNPNNVGGVVNFSQQYPDYMNIPTTSADWSRMDVNTRDFIVKLNDALQKAIDLTSTSIVPPGYSRVVRNGRYFLSFTHGGFNYLVLSKASY